MSAVKGPLIRPILTVAHIMPIYTHLFPLNSPCSSPLYSPLYNPPLRSLDYSSYNANIYPPTKALRLKIAQRPYIVWSLGPKALHYESLEP